MNCAHTAFDRNEAIELLATPWQRDSRRECINVPLPVEQLSNADADVGSLVICVRNVTPASAATLSAAAPPKYISTSFLFLSTSLCPTRCPALVPHAPYMHRNGRVSGLQGHGICQPASKVMRL